MFAFITLRESTTRPGTIEPDILPTSSAASTTSRTGLFPTSVDSGSGSTSAKANISRWSSSYQEWITRWDLSDHPATLRKILCIAAVGLHVPMNVISIVSYGLSLWAFLGIIMSVLNLVCVGISLWKLDEMRGGRLVYGKIYKRHNFDYVILALFLIYGFAFSMFVFAKLRFRTWVLFLRIVWPCLVATDIFCFVSGWIATWTDVSLG